MENKVRLPREVGNSIKRIRENYKSGCEYDLEFLSKERYSGMDEITEFVYESRENMILYYQALVNGYEIEETPEEKIQEMFKKPGPFNDGIGEMSTAYRNGIRDTLDTLNITIKGVNDNE